MPSADGTGMLADCLSHPEAGGERALEAAETVAEACAQVGLVYRRLEPLEKTLAANLKRLAGYRHPRNQGHPGLAAAVLEAFTQPRPLIEGVEAIGDAIEVLPVAFHALWHGQLTVALDVPLHERALVQAPVSGVRCPATGSASRAVRVTSKASAGPVQAAERPGERGAAGWAAGGGGRCIRRSAVAGCRSVQAGLPPGR
ncbi:TnsA-like heteromeric transposase endonuclease subunit [Streptomyces gelaticus]